MNALIKFTPALVAVLVAAQPLAVLAQPAYSSQYGYGGTSQPSNQGSNADNYPDTPYDSTQTHRNLGSNDDVPPPPPPPGPEVYQQQPQYRNYADVQREQQDQGYQGQSYQGQPYQGQSYQGQSGPARPYDDRRDDGRDYPQGNPQAYAQNPSQQNQNYQPPAPNPNDRRYDGYCYERKADAEASGTIIGTIAGALIGNGVSNHRDKGAGTVAGAIIGGAIGSSAGRSSVECYGGRYYAYDEGYYAPPPPPEGYTVVYYYNRPAPVYYERVYGYRDFYYGYGYSSPRYYSRYYYGPSRGYYGRGRHDYYRRW
ncbi:MAG TPA: glycine zipper 2TM domain-containing protein [Asticcacaulis sp.]|nr:glycine zipper 2TM domain-containing protein [Asticcacaulis sp.]